MKVKNVIGECLTKMGRTNFVNKTQFDSEESELISKLLCALNIAYRETVTEYLPLIYAQTVVLKDKIVKTSVLDKKILYPVSLEFCNEIKRIKAYPDRIESDFDGEGVLTYAYIPDDDLVLSDEISDMRLTQSALADGTLGEYYFANKVFDLAKSFDADFRAQMSMLRYKGRRIRIKRRRWQA